MDDGKNKKILQALIVSLFIIGTSAQYSLDEMIQKVQREQGFVFAPQSAPQPPPQLAQSVPQPAYNPSISVDSRFDAGVSNEVSTNILQLAHNIGTRISQENAKTQIFSPMSIAGALSLLLLGANGRTFNELMKLMGYDRSPQLLQNPYKIHEEFGLIIEDLISDYINPSRPRPLTPWKYMTHNESNHGNPPDINYASPSDYHKISIANGIFIQNGFSLRPNYQEAVSSIYKSKIISLDFQNNPAGATNYINEWVSYETRGKINQIVGGEIQSQTNMIIASALYFKALWEKTFIEGGTNTKNFYPDGLGTTPIPVEMMAHGGVFPFYDAKEYNCRILGLPYKGNMTTMYIILPNDSNKQRLRETQALLTADKIEDMIAKMQLKTAVMLFPKMHIQNSLNLKHIFAQMGLTSLFVNGLSDLSLISNGRVLAYGGNRVINRNTQAPMASPPQSNSSPTNLNNKDQLIFSRFSEDTTTNRTKRAVKYKVESSFRRNREPLRYKDYVLGKRITKSNADKKVRSKRQLNDPSASIKALDNLRNRPSLANPNIFAEDIVHKIDLTINERGTEGGAATIVYLTRTGTDVVFRVETPFLLLIRHDSTKIPLFYGSIYEPTNF